jgi:hypothetical protein
MRRRRVGPGDLIGVAECAAMARLLRSNFVRDHANHPDFPRPIAELAAGRVWMRADVAAYFEARRQTRAKR